MTPSKNCINLIKRFEGFSRKPYICPAGVATIGYGMTFYPDGSKVTMRSFPITEEQAEADLTAIVAKFAKSVDELVKVTLTQNQFDALVSLAFNIGIGNLSRSSLLRHLNAGDFVNASKQFDKWVFAKGKKLSGLVNRRNAEKKLFEGK